MITFGWSGTLLLRASHMGGRVAAMEATPTYTEAVRAAVAGAMERAGINATRLSQTTGIAPTTLSRKINGLAPFTVLELDVIPRCLSIPVSDLSWPDRDAA